MYNNLYFSLLDISLIDYQQYTKLHMSYIR